MVHLQIGKILSLLSVELRTEPSVGFSHIIFSSLFTIDVKGNPSHRKTLWHLGENAGLAALWMKALQEQARKIGNRKTPLMTFFNLLCSQKNITSLATLLNIELLACYVPETNKRCLPLHIHVHPQCFLKSKAVRSYRSSARLLPSIRRKHNGTSCKCCKQRKAPNFHFEEAGTIEG